VAFGQFPEFLWKITDLTQGSLLRSRQSNDPARTIFSWREDWERGRPFPVGRGAPVIAVAVSDRIRMRHL
jgi:hypothetical protein